MGLFEKLFGKRPSAVTSPTSQSSPPLVPATDLKPSDFRAEQVFALLSQDAIAALDALRGNRATSGLVPVILGGSEDLALLIDTRQIVEEDGLSPDQALERASILDTEKWLADAATQRKTDAEEDPELLNEVGTWPDIAPGRTKLETHLDVPDNRVYLAVFRTDASWKVPALLLWSSFNYDMGPDLHTAMHRRWNKLYGSEVVSVTGSVIQCHVSRPPQTKEEAMRLAWEQYYYCPDIVSQGVGTVSDLAATLLNADIWYFWWD